MDSGHQTFENTPLIVHYFGQRSKTVGCARSVGDDGFAFVFLVVDAHDEHWSVFGGGGNDNAFGAAFEMGFGFRLFGKFTGGFENVLGTTLAPLDHLGLFFLIDIDFVAIDDELAVFGSDIAFETAMDRVVAEHVDHVFEIDERVVNCNDLDVRILQSGAEEKPAYASESINTYFDSHDVTPDLIVRTDRGAEPFGPSRRLQKNFGSLGRRRRQVNEMKRRRAEKLEGRRMAEPKAILKSDFSPLETD